MMSRNDTNEKGAVEEVPVPETAEISDDAFEEEWESEADEEGVVVEKDKDDPSAFGDDGMEE